MRYGWGRCWAHGLSAAVADAVPPRENAAQSLGAPVRRHTLCVPVPVPVWDARYELSGPVIAGFGLWWANRRIVCVRGKPMAFWFYVYMLFEWRRCARWPGGDGQRIVRSHATSCPAVGFGGWAIFRVTYYLYHRAADDTAWHCKTLRDTLGWRKWWINAWQRAARLYLSSWVNFRLF